MTKVSKTIVTQRKRRRERPSSFVHGMASVLRIAPSSPSQYRFSPLPRPPYPLSHRRLNITVNSISVIDDQSAVPSDWQKVSNDLKTTVQRLEKQI